MAEKQQLIDKIDKTLDAIRPYLEADGGNVKVVSLNDEQTIVTVELLGSCNGCPMSDSTFKAGIVETIKARVPQIEEVVALNVTQPS